MYKLIVTDMDGTLLNSIGEIPEENLREINKAVSAGIKFAIVTGRPYISVKDILADNNISCSVIGCNGAQVTDENGRLLRAHYLNKETLIKIIDKADTNGLYYQIYSDDFIYSKSRFGLVRILSKYSGKSSNKSITPKVIINGIKKLFFSQVKTVKNVKDFAQNSSKNFYKIMIASLDSEKLKNFKDSLSDFDDIGITSSFYTNIEIGAKGITKGTALQELAESQNINQSEIIAMGDNYNDIPMIEYAGCGVAMENAEPEVKSSADFCTKSNIENGVAYAIEKLIFEQK